MLETYGLHMIGLEDASLDTADWPAHCGYCNIVRYDPEAGDVWVTEAHYSQLAGRYDVFRTSKHVSAQRIADEIAYHMQLMQQ